MLQDLISAQLISDYIIVELPSSINDLEGTRRVRTLAWLIVNLSSLLMQCKEQSLHFL